MNSLPCFQTGPLWRCLFPGPSYYLSFRFASKRALPLGFPCRAHTERDAPFPKPSICLSKVPENEPFRFLIGVPYGESCPFPELSLAYQVPHKSFPDKRNFTLLSKTLGKELPPCPRKRGKGEGMAIPLQAWTGPEGSRKLRLPDFKTISTWRW